MSSEFDVTVVIPCFNAEAFLGEAIASALGQSRPPVEVVVVDDGSTDNSAAIAAGFGDRVRLIRQDNRGESRARNVGMEVAQGDWIAFLDADDVWEPHKLETQARYATASDVVAIHSWFRRLRNGQVYEEPVPSHMRPPVYELVNLLLNFVVLPSSAVVRRSVQVRFPEWTKAGEDALYFAELSQAGRFAFAKEPLVRYRQHEAAQSAPSVNIVRARESVLKWLNRASVVTPYERRRIRRELFVDLAARTQLAIWKRDWPLVQAARSFAQDHVEADDPVLVALSAKLWPKWLYSVVDRLTAS